jgi:peroxiredoxin
MSHLLIPALALAGLVVLVGCWLGWQLLRQNGRMLLRLDEMEKRLDELELGELGAENGSAPGADALSPHDPAVRFNNRSLARSKIKRDGLKAGTPAPDFRLPRVDGRGDLSLAELRGKRVLLVFSSPHCGPCNTLAPELEKFHRQHPEKNVLMIGKGEAKENRAKVKAHGLTFPVLLQQQWEVSRRYAMFATPIAYLIDEAGVIMRDVAIGIDAISGLLAAQGETPPATKGSPPPTHDPSHGLERRTASCRKFSAL